MERDGGESRTTTLFAASYPERTTALVALNPSIKGRPTADYPWAPSDATWRETLLFSSDQRGSAEFCAGARGRGRATRLSTMRGEYTWVDDATHETAKGAAKTPTVGKLAGHDQSDRPVGPGGTLEFPLGCRLGGNFRSARAGRHIPPNASGGRIGASDALYKQDRLRVGDP